MNALAKQLWCVHVAGPDDLLATKDRATAVRNALWLNIGMWPLLRDHADKPHAPTSWASPAPWPGTPEAHAEALAEQDAQDPRWSSDGTDAPRLIGLARDVQLDGPGAEHGEYRIPDEAVHVLASHLAGPGNSYGLAERAHATAVLRELVAPLVDGNPFPPEEEVLNRTMLAGMGPDNGGWALDVRPPHRLAVALAEALARTIGDAPNYSETSFDLRVAGQPQRFAFRVQRVDGKTPHELRVDADLRMKTATDVAWAALNLAIEHGADQCEDGCGTDVEGMSEQLRTLASS